jgi:hypothetical protein
MLGYACSLRELSELDMNDIDALRDLLEQCTALLLDPIVWLWTIVFTIVTVAVGSLIGWYKGRTIVGLVWGAALGPIGWLVMAFYPISWKTCSQCGRVERADRRRCNACGAALSKSH